MARASEARASYQQGQGSHHLINRRACSLLDPFSFEWLSCGWEGPMVRQNFGRDFGGFDVIPPLPLRSNNVTGFGRHR